ncbi:MAG: rhodanese family protein [Proteobacteria bacterium]|nr:rhodanese family protein [Pseudomonadota bacterium]
MTTHYVEPREALRLVNDGALLIDVREGDEHAREHIANARSVPLSRLAQAIDRPKAQQVVFHCLSGNRTEAAADRLAAAAGGDAYVLRGGLRAWKAAGLPVIRDPRQPIEMARQVQITAGSLVLAGVGLGALLHPGFYALAGFIGAGLVFSGASGTCTMARVLAIAPWNRVRRA